MTVDPKVTIGMPVFNNAASVERAIRSVIGQSVRDWRLIVTDDGSRDETWSIVEELAQTDHRIEAVRNSRRLMFQNFRVSLEMARTPYFVWLAGDDYWGAHFLEETLATLESSPDAVSAITRCRFLDAPDSPYLPTLDGSRVTRIGRYLSAPGGTRMYGLTRTEVLRSSFPDRNMNAYDWFLMLGVLSAGAQLVTKRTELFRSFTELSSYVDMGHNLQRGLFRLFPVSKMSFSAAYAGFVPLRNFRDLFGLNLRKHEEYMAYIHPGSFARLRRAYALAGLPIANSPERSRDAALASLSAGRKEGAERLLRVTSSTSPKTPAEPRHAPRLTAIITCRNASPTLAGLLDHLSRHDADTIVIDNGSTDDTRAIASSRMNGPVSRIIDDPYRGFFDLTRQLRLKRDLIRNIGEGWIIHADADEFIDSPDGGPLRDYLRNVPGGVRSFACDEIMFVPKSDDERHLPETFEETMVAGLRMIERDTKERVFRADVPLSRWMATGGHSVLDGGKGVSNVRLRVRHYFALSLDQVRSEYLSRVYAPHDLAKFWHSSRRANSFDIIAPPEGAVSEVEPLPSAKSVPVFRARDAGRSARNSGTVDLVIASGTEARSLLDEVIEREFPSLRVADVAVGQRAPLLHIMNHPAREFGADDVDGAEKWLRRVAGARQHAIWSRVPFHELRIEDTNETSLGRYISDLVLGRSTGIVASGSLPPHILDEYGGRLRRITGALARDLSYG